MYDEESKENPAKAISPAWYFDRLIDDKSGGKVCPLKGKKFNGNR